MEAIADIERHLVSSILSSKGQAQYECGDVAHDELTPLANHIRRISAHYVEHAVGTALTSPIVSLAAAQAYALYYLPINAAKVVHLLRLLQLGSRPLSVLDVGCGPGTAGLALMAALPNKISLTCVESSREMRTLAQSLLSSYKSKDIDDAIPMHPSLNQVGSQKFDLIVAANVLAEMAEGEASRALEKLLGCIAPHGHLLLIEPGQQLHTRRLMKLRDQICAHSDDVKPIFPCFRSSPCPMLQQSNTDWCHGEIEWQQPRLHAQLDRLLGFNKHRIKYSAFIFQRDGQLCEGTRVITPPRKTSAGVEALICGHETYGLVRIAKRNRGPNSRAFEKAGVFDRLIFSQQCIGEAPPDITIEDATHLRPESAEKR